jgi:hypothetical protein
MREIGKAYDIKGLEHLRKFFVISLFRKNLYLSKHGGSDTHITIQKYFARQERGMLHDYDGQIHEKENKREEITRIGRNESGL